MRASCSESSLLHGGSRHCNKFFFAAAQSEEHILFHSQQLVSLAEKKEEKERLCQQGNPCLRELKKRFTSGASTRQAPTIKLGRGLLVESGA